jgi:protein-S-isoprenylcysteine O-methyltransferase Ste14
LNDPPVLQQSCPMRWLELRMPPPVVAGVCGLLMWLLARALPAADFALPAKGAIAVAVGLLAAVLFGMAIFQFMRARTTVNPMKPDNASALVVDGVFRLSRNPIYLADLVFLLAWGLWLANAAALALLPLFVAYLNRFQIVPEERALEARFGTAFAAYRRAVRRWL